jgi:hypothetical protein
MGPSEYRLGLWLCRAMDSRCRDAGKDLAASDARAMNEGRPAIETFPVIVHCAKGAEAKRAFPAVASRQLRWVAL